MGFRAILVAALVGGGAAGATTWFFLAVLGREPPTLLVPLVAVGLGMFAAQMMRILTADPDAGDDEADEEAEEEATPEQTVGKRCTVCEEPIRVARDAAECDDCGGVFHDGCFDDHLCA